MPELLDLNKLRATYEVDEIPEDELVSMLLENCVGKYNQYESHMIPRFFWLYSNIISLLRIKINDVYTQQLKHLDQELLYFRSQ